MYSDVRSWFFPPLSLSLLAYCMCYICRKGGKKSHHQKFKTLAMEDNMNNGDDVHFLIAADIDEPISSLPRSFDDSYFDKFPDGYRFTPTDEELILCYLKKKIENIPLPPNRIRDEDIYQFNPNTLAGNF